MPPWRNITAEKSPDDTGKYYYDLEVKEVSTSVDDGVREFFKGIFDLPIEDYIYRELSLEEQNVAIEFICFLKDNHLDFYKDNCDYWKDKIYYWVKSENDCVCFIAINNPDERNNRWTVWSADMGSEWLENDVENEVKELAWRYVDHCGHCGSCGGGRHKIIFGKEFNDVCGCTFRIDNPKRGDLIFLKKMVEIRMKEMSLM